MALVGEMIKETTKHHFLLLCDRQKIFIHTGFLLPLQNKEYGRKSDSMSDSTENL